MRQITLSTCITFLLSGLVCAQGTLPAESLQGVALQASAIRPVAAHAPGQLIVRFDSSDLAHSICAESDGRWELGDLLVRDLDVYLVHFDGERVVLGERETLNGTAGVLYAMENGRMSLRQTLPNDPQFAQQASHNNTGQTGGAIDADIDAPEAWDIALGSDEYVVAIVDAGGMTDHEDLIDNRWENLPEINGVAGVDDDNNGYVDDFYGWNTYNNNGQILSSSHGTRVAGIVGARGDNGLGGVGVVWETDLM